MDTQKQPNKLRSRRGITIVEVAITLVLIFIISAAALSMIIMSLNVDKNAIAAVEAKSSAENAVNCFRFAENNNEFLSALQKTAPYEVADDGTYVLSARGFSVKIYANIVENAFLYTAVNPEGETIYSYIYPRAFHDTTIDISGFTDPTTKNNWDLVAYAKHAYEKHWGYVWGTYGKVLTEGLLESKINQYPEQVGGKQEFIRLAWLGGRVADCVGLIKGYCWLDPETLEFKYATNGMNDFSANQTFQSVAASDKGTIDTIPEIPGLAVWHEDHIGIYIGEGKVIHAKGTKQGVVCTTFAQYGEWTHWLRVPGLTYTDTPPETTEPSEPTVDTTEPTVDVTEPTVDATEPAPTETVPAPTETEPETTEEGGAS